MNKKNGQSTLQQHNVVGSALFKCTRCKYKYTEEKRGTRKERGSNYDTYCCPRCKCVSFVRLSP